MNKIFIICLYSLLLTACGYNAYKVPTLQEAGLPSDEVIQKYNIDKAWWENYNDPQLNKLLDIALINNFEIQSSLFALKTNLIAIREEEGNFIPSAVGNFSTSGTRPLTSSQNLSNPLNANVTTGLSLDLNFWHNLPTLDAAKWSAKASDEDLESVRLAVAFGLIDAYFTLMYHNNLYKLQVENTRFLEKVLKTVEYKQKVGRVDGLEPLTAKQALTAAKEKVIQTHTHINDTLILIRNFLNMNHTEQLNIVPFNIITQKTIEVNLHVPLEVLSLRPDIRKAEYLAQSSLHLLKKSHRTWIPSVTIGSILSSNGNLNSSTSQSHFLSSQSFSLFGNLQISLPFLSWWNIKWEVKNAENAMEQSLFAFTATINQALNQVHSLYYSYQNEKLIFKLAKEKTNIDAGIFEYRKNRYNEGRDDLKIWLEANTNANNSLENFVLAKLKIIRKENSVFQAMGGKITEKKNPVQNSNEVENNTHLNNNDEVEDNIPQ